MNRRRLVLAQSLCCIVLLLSLPGAAMAQLSGVRGLNEPGEIRPVVEPFVKQQVARFAADDVNQQSQARDLLIAEASGQPNPTAVFLDVYAAILNEQLQPLMKNENLRIRLNAAIVAARVAEQAQNARMREMALAAMKDKTEAVVLWGLKIAGNVIPTLLQVQNPANQGVLKTVAAVVKDHRSSLTTQYAYRALMLDILNERRRLSGQAFARAVPLVVPEMQEILQWRIAQYKNTTPADPMLEARFPVLFLTERSVFAAQSDQQRMRTMQLLVDLMSSAAQRAALNQDANIANEDREALATVVVRAAGALQVAGQASGAPQVQQAVAGVVQLNPRNVNGGQLLEAVKPIPQQLRQAPQLKGLKDPPAVEARVVAVEDPTAPSTAPATGEAMEPLPEEGPAPTGAGQTGAGPTAPPPSRQ